MQWNLILNKIMNDIKEAAKLFQTEDEEQQSYGNEILAHLKIESFQGESIVEKDAKCFQIIMSKCEDASKSLVIESIAELAKTDENRMVFTMTGIIPQLLQEIESNDREITLQCFRAIGNVCIENDEAQKVILHSGCISKILQKIKSMADLSDDELGNLPAMAFGCVNNMSGENESLQAEMVHQGAIPIFFNSLKSFINKDSDMAELVIDALAAFATSDAAKEQMIASNVVGESLSFLKTCNDKITMAVMNALCDLIRDDDLSEVICADSNLVLLLDAIASRQSFKENTTDDETLKKMADSLVLFTSNESFTATNSNKHLLRRFLEMVKSPNKYIQVSGALAIGNYARNDLVCSDLVNDGIHVELIELLKSIHKNEECLEEVQAILSALKNIAIPIANKSQLSKTDLPNIVSDVIKDSPAVVQFKALGILRLLVQGQSELAVKLCEDDELLKSIAECAERDTIIGICAEGRRLTAALVKNCQSNASMNSVLRNDGMRSLIALLSSDHVLMQNEGLVAMVILLTCGQDACEKLLEADGLKKAIKLLKQSTNKPHLLINLISLCTSVCQNENCKTMLQENIMNEIESMANGPNEMIQRRCVPLLNLLKK